MNFIGQAYIQEQLEFILPDIKDNGSAAFMLRGPSGYGKTDLAVRICNYVSGSRYTMKLGDVTTFYDDIRTHLVDEIHLCRTPEMYYPLIDSNEYIFVFTTNSDSTLPEALVNRCYDFIFDNYEDEDLLQIISSRVPEMVLPNEQLVYIIEFCNRNPRIILSTVQRLVMWQRRYSIRIADLSMEDFSIIMERVFGVKDGVDILCRRYLEALTGLGGRASLSSIQSQLHVDEGTIKAQIEPALLYKNKITITSRGRSII